MQKIKQKKEYGLKLLKTFHFIYAKYYCELHIFTIT